MKKKIEHYIETWKTKGYSIDIPDVAPDRLTQLNKVPSYKSIALAILKNDNNLVTLGYAAPKSSCYSALKKVEIEQRQKTKIQFNLFKE